MFCICLQEVNSKVLVLCWKGPCPRNCPKLLPVPVACRFNAYFFQEEKALKKRRIYEVEITKSSLKEKYLKMTQNFVRKLDRKTKNRNCCFLRLLLFTGIYICTCVSLMIYALNRAQKFLTIRHVSCNLSLTFLISCHPGRKHKMAPC